MLNRLLSTVTDLGVNHSFDFLKVYMSTFADSIEILNSEMTKITGSILSLDKETEDLGIYSAPLDLDLTNGWADAARGAARAQRGRIG